MFYGKILPFEARKISHKPSLHHVINAYLYLSIYYAVQVKRIMFYIQDAPVYRPARFRSLDSTTRTITRLYFPGLGALFEPLCLVDSLIDERMLSLRGRRRCAVELHRIRYRCPISPAPSWEIHQLPSHLVPICYITAIARQRRAAISRDSLFLKNADFLIAYTWAHNGKEFKYRCK